MNETVEIGKSGDDEASLQVVNNEALIKKLVKESFDSELRLLKDTGGLALKIVGAAFALFFAVFTLFGISTWNDIKEETAAYIRDKADKLVFGENSQQGVKNTLDELVNKAIVSSALIELSNGNEITLRPNEWRRLRLWAQQENLDLDTFSDILRVLDSQEEDRKTKDSLSFLSDMLQRRNGSAFEWMRSQPNKVRAIFENFTDQNLGYAAFKALSADDFSNELKTAALKYIGAVGYNDTFNELIDLAKETSGGPYWNQLMVTSAILDAGDDQFRLEFGRGDKRDLSDIGLPIRILRELIERESGSEFDEGTHSFFSQQLTELVNNGAFVERSFSFSGFNRISPARILSSGERVRLTIAPEGERPRRFTLSGSEALINSQLYIGHLESLLKNNDLQGFKQSWLTDRTSVSRRFNTIGKSRASLIAELSPSSTIEVTLLTDQTEQIIDRQRAPAVYIYPSKSKESMPIIAWTDKNGDELLGELIAITGGDIRLEGRYLRDSKDESLTRR